MAAKLYRIGTLAVFGVGAACAAATTSPEPEHVSSSPQPVTGTCATPVIVDQSLFVAPVTGSNNAANPFGVAALANFSFQAVMNQIVSTGAGPGSGQTALELYQQLVDTMNDKGGGFTSGPHCTGKINGFPVDCPRPEGQLAQTNPFTGKGKLAGGVMTPLALVNRFDLAPNNGANCGEYRVVFGISTGVPAPVARFLMIFEATLPNPNPAAKLEGCLPVAKFWDNLSSPTITQAEFASQLQQFYFKGLAGADGGPPFAPVIQAANYGFGAPKNTNTGQIRVNMLSNPDIEDGGILDSQWQLREFKLSQDCPDAGGACVIVANNTFVANNPFGGLFNTVPADGGAKDQTFQTDFIKRVKSLSASSIPLISMTTNNVDNAGQSSEQDSTNNYRTQATGNTALSNAIQAELKALDSGLTPGNILDRATTQSCAGCHQLSPNTNLGGPDGGLKWPASNLFTQVNELPPNVGSQSPALTNVFLPFRSTVLTNFIDKHCGAVDAGADDGDGTLTVSGQATGAAN